MLINSGNQDSSVVGEAFTETILAVRYSQE